MKNKPYYKENFVWIGYIYMWEMGMDFIYFPRVAIRIKYEILNKLPGT